MTLKKVFITSDGKQFELESEAEKHNDLLESTKGKAVVAYLNQTRAGRNLMDTYSLSEEGFWQINGEDPNCDFGGEHHQPYLATVKGTLKAAVEYAVTLDYFYTWGAGGAIKKIDVVVLDQE